MPTSTPTHARARLAALRRWRPADDPDVASARAACRVEYARATVEHLRSQLTGAERAELAALLASPEDPTAP